MRAAVVDHRLQDGSAERAAATVALLAERGIAARVHAVDVTGPGGIEAAARRARQAALRAARPHPDSPILLGHTLDDQAETVLLGLGRGSGARSLAGMRRWDPPWLRPLLTVRPNDDAGRLRGARRCGTTRTTPTPASPGSGCATRSCRCWRTCSRAAWPRRSPAPPTQLRDDVDALDAVAAQLLAAACAPATPSSAAPSSAAPAGRAAPPRPARPSPAPRARPSRAEPRRRQVRHPRATAPELDLAVLADVPPALRRRVLRAWLTAAGVTGLTDTHLRAADVLAARGPDRAGVAVPGGLELFRAHGRLGIRPVRWPSAR